MCDRVLKMFLGSSSSSAASASALKTEHRVAVDATPIEHNVTVGIANPLKNVIDTLKKIPNPLKAIPNPFNVGDDVDDTKASTRQGARQSTRPPKASTATNARQATR
ncbi:MAG: hypothetical protein VXW74_00550 [Candidatus Thermoplasmatota archaeon]|nr:hypothetical protein [Candidatus Thermoplasmatota archaeon]